MKVQPLTHLWAMDVKIYKSLDGKPISEQVRSSLIEERYAS